MESLTLFGQDGEAYSVAQYSKSTSQIRFRGLQFVIPSTFLVALGRVS